MRKDQAELHKNKPTKGFVSTRLNVKLPQLHTTPPRLLQDNLKEKMHHAMHGPSR